MLMRSLPSNAPFDRSRGLVEIGASEADTPDKLRDHILRMDSYIKCDRELANKLDKQQGNCFHCRRPGHLEKGCNKKDQTQVPASGSEQATYTGRLGKSEQTADRRYFREYTPFENDIECVKGFKKKFAANPVGHGTVQLLIVLQRGDLDLVLALRDIFHVPNSRKLLAHSQAEDQGYSVERDKYGLFKLTTRNAFLPVHARIVQATGQARTVAPPRVNISAAGGVADLRRWHESLGHLCPQIVKRMVNKDLVNGMMLRQQRFTDCVACHMGKEIIGQEGDESRDHTKERDELLGSTIPGSSDHSPLNTASRFWGQVYRVTFMLSSYRTTDRLCPQEGGTHHCSTVDGLAPLTIWFAMEDTDSLHSLV
ncbi:hypothetical protein PC128_g13850 [Phytophthora cactorum]|nr:hypothetical protein PC128_g13850 [Phytophthora cactorum]